MNLDSVSVKNEIKNIMDFWLREHKVDGFRLDAITSYFTNNVEKNVEFLSWLAKEAKSIKDCFIVGEAWEDSDGKIAEYYKSNINGCFLFTGAQRGGRIANAIKSGNASEFSQWLSSLDNTYGGMIMPFLGNHDTMRPASFMGDEQQTKMAFGMLSMMSGSISLYYGEEIGLTSEGGENSDEKKRIAMFWDYGDEKGNCYYNAQGRFAKQIRISAVKRAKDKFKQHIPFLQKSVATQKFQSCNRARKNHGFGLESSKLCFCDSQAIRGKIRNSRHELVKFTIYIDIRWQCVAFGRAVSRFKCRKRRSFYTG